MFNLEILPMELVNKQKEIWKDIKGYEGLYQISNYGRVKALPKKITWVQKDGVECFRLAKTIILKENRQFYATVKLCNNGAFERVTIHYLVASHFLKNANNYKYINHIDGDKFNNHYSNLEFCTARENKSHSIDKSKTSSQYTGVYLKKGHISKPWAAGINFDGKNLHLGYYPTEIEAHNAYLEALNRNNLNNKYAANV